MARITINLKDQEKTALRILAENEFRDPRAQAVLIIRLELERLGLLKADTANVKTVPAGGGPNKEGNNATS